MRSCESSVPPVAGFQAVGRSWHGRVPPPIGLMIAFFGMLLAALLTVVLTVVHQPAVLSS